MTREALVAAVIVLPMVLATCERAPPAKYTPIVYPPLPSALPPETSSSATAAPTKPELPPTTPSLFDYAVFEFFAETGTFEVYSALGRLLKREDDTTSFRDGRVRFIQVTPSQGIISGNAATGDVEVRRTDRTLSFIERNAFHVHVLTIQDRWLPDKHGFAATYSRNIENPLRQERMVSVFSGVAVPPGREPAR